MVTCYLTHLELALRVPLPVLPTASVGREGDKQNAVPLSSPWCIRRARRHPPMGDTDIAHERERLIGILDFLLRSTHPRTHDLVPAPTRFPKWIDPIESVLGEQRSNVLGVVRDPCLEVALQPASKALRFTPCTPVGQLEGSSPCRGTTRRFPALRNAFDKMA
jgi:hypothetical protein